MKLKYFSFIIMFVAVFGSILGFAGCSDIYANLKIKVSETEVTLKLDDSAEEDLSSAYITATIEGLTEVMDTGLNFGYSDRSIVRAEVVSFSNGEAKIKITAQSAGVTTLRVISNETSKVYSEDILVTVNRDATSMVFNKERKPCVALGSSLELVTNDLITFYVDEEISTVYPNRATFELMTPENDFWDFSYGFSNPDGVSLEDNILTVDDDAECGVVQIIASMPNEISVPILVMVYDEIDLNQITLMKDGQVIQSLSSVINTIGGASNAFNLTANVDSVAQDFLIDIVSNDSDILIVGAPNAIGDRACQAVESGVTTLTVLVSVIDIVTGTIYKTFEKDYNVEIVRIVTDIFVTVPNKSASSTQVSTTIEDYYRLGVYGSEVSFTVSENSRDDRVTLAVTNIDGVEFVDDACNDIVIYTSKRADAIYNWGEYIPSGTTFYVALAEGSSIKQNFVLTLRANTSNPEWPVATNSVLFNVQAGVEAVTSTVDDLMVGVDCEGQFGINFETSIGENRGSPTFSITVKNEDITEVRQGENYLFYVTGLKEGNTDVTITADSGEFVVVSIVVREAISEFYLDIVEEGSNILSKVYNASDYVNAVDGLGDGGISSFDVRQGTIAEIEYNVNPSYTSELSLSIEDPVIDEEDRDYIEITNFNDGTFVIVAKRATLNDDYITISVNFTFYKNQDNNLVEFSSSRKLEIRVVQLIEDFYWSGTNKSTEIREIIYNQNRLNIEQQDKASVTLEAVYNEDATYFIKGGAIEWSINDESKVEMVIDEDNNNIITLTAKMDSSMTAERYEVVVTGVVYDYEIPYILTCNLIILNPELVKEIKVINYDEDKGIRLNDLGDELRTSYDLYVNVLEETAFNKEYGYKLYEAVWSDAEFKYVAGEEIVEEDAIISLNKSDNIIRVQAKEEKVGRIIIKLYPMDAITSENTDFAEIISTDILVVVESGTVENPYTIYNADEFVAIGSSLVAMTKHYQIMQTINLNNYASYLPLGYEFGGVFTGTLSSYKNNFGDQARYSIINIPVCSNLIGVEGEEGSFGGLFAKVQSTDEVSTNISNIDFYFKNGIINITDDNSNRDVYIGLLAGKMESNLENVFVNYTSYKTSSISIVNNTSTERKISFGAVAGEYNFVDNDDADDILKGNVKNVYSNISANILVSDLTCLIVGGMFGKFNGEMLGQEDELLNNVKLEIVRNGSLTTDSIGGLIGEFSGQLYGMQVVGQVNAKKFSNVGGLIGTNTGLLGEFRNNTIYRNLVNVRVEGENNVGGLIGSNFGAINYARVENYENVDNSNEVLYALVYGQENVGGLIGYDNGGVIQYSYAMSYIKREAIVTLNSELDDNSYFGDILGQKNVGGLIGRAENTAIASSFAYNRIQHLADSGYVGGLIGSASLDDNVVKSILASFAVSRIVSENSNLASNVGELIGYVECGASATLALNQCYARTYISSLINEDYVYNLIADVVGSIESTACFYMSDKTDSSTGEAELSYENGLMDPSMYQLAGWGFGSNADTNYWCSYTGNSGINEDLPVLKDADGSMMYSQAITNFTKVEVNYLKEDSNILPTYFDYSGLGAVVVLDNVPVVENQKVLYLFKNLVGSDYLSGLLNIEVEPVLDIKKWQIRAYSSDYSIMEIEQTSQNLIDTKLIFKKSGVVVLSLQSLLDVNATAEVVINIIDGFSNFDILSGDSDLSVIGNNLHIKTNTGLNLIPEFVINNGLSRVIKGGIAYTVGDTEIIGFDKIANVLDTYYVPSNKANLLFGKKNSNKEFVEVIACPYVELEFNGVIYNYEFSNIAKSFMVKIYDGIVNIGLSEKQAGLLSGEYLNIDLTVQTDDVFSVEIADIKLFKDGQAVDSAIINNFVQLLESNFDDEKGEIVNSYLFELKGQELNITQDVVLNAIFTVMEEDGTIHEREIEVVFSPAVIKRVDAWHYTYGSNAMEAGEASSNLIAPGNAGLLKVEITPNYADYDTVILSSSVNSDGQYVKMIQVVIQNGVYRSLPTGSIYDEDGNLLAQKITGFDSNGNAYFNGVIYASTHIPSSTVENEVFDITIVPLLRENPAFASKIVSLVSTFAPNAVLSFESSYGNNIVARGTVANLRLVGELQDSVISMSTDYVASRELEISTFVVGSEFKYEYNSGDREKVDVIIPFYVGLEANTNKINILVSIESKTKQGIVLNTLLLKLELNVVDYVIDSVIVAGSQDNEINVGIKSYTSLTTSWNWVQPRYADFARYIGTSVSEQEFSQKVDLIRNKINSKKAIIDARESQPVWEYYQGGAYSALDADQNYLNFVYVYSANNYGQNYSMLRGKSALNGLNFRLTFETYYILNNGVYEFAIAEDITNSNEDLIMKNYVRKLEQNFVVNLINNTTDDEPDLIQTAQDLRSMSAGLHYILMNDIELYDWEPLNTEIASLDGNGYVIKLNSFAKTTNDTEANYGLFGTLSSESVLRNIILDVSNNVYVDLQNIGKVNFGFIAGINEGVIFNSEVVVTHNKEEWLLTKNGLDAGNHLNIENADFNYANKMFDNIKKLGNNNTIASTFIYTSKTLQGNSVLSNVGGLVGINKGTITNGRVGRIGEIDSILRNSEDNNTYQGLNIFASGNVGGLAGQNDGVISNSYFANGYIVNSKMDIYNSSNVNGARTGGLVAIQSSTGRIFGSYAQGQTTDLTKIGRTIYGGIMAYGSVGGLVHSNSGDISNSYTNLVLSGSNGMGGFVYENLGFAQIKTSYSMSTVDTSGLMNGVFIGLDTEGNLLDNSNATVENCYYLDEKDEKGQILIKNVDEKASGIFTESWIDASASSFEGFVVGDENNNSTWFFDKNNPILGPQLRLANNVYKSIRSSYDGYLIEEQGFEKGSENNPIIIYDLDSWKQVFAYDDSENRSKFVEKRENATAKDAYYQFAGEETLNVMLLDDIDFGKSIDEITSNMKFEGNFYGNGYVLSGLGYTLTDVKNNFGLFASIENGSVLNLNLVISDNIATRALHVGVLAGEIINSFIDGITITGENSSLYVLGNNMTGALAGYIGGDSKVYNVVSTVIVSSISSTTQNKEYSYYVSSSNKYDERLSYAGGIIGVLDLDVPLESLDTTANPRVRNLNVTNEIRISTEKHIGLVDIYAEIAGGIVGLVGANSEIYKAYFDLSDEYESKIRGKNFAGGLVGELRGKIINGRISLANDKQIAKDSSIIVSSKVSDFVDYRTLFNHNEATNAIGGLVGLSAGGRIDNSYSRVSVISNNARSAGGIIGMSISSVDYSDVNNSEFKYLRQLGITTAENLFKEFASQERGFGATLHSVYTTGAVESGRAMGGLVGSMIGGPINTESGNASLASINNYEVNSSSYIAKVRDTSKYYVGSLIGFVSNLSGDIFVNNQFQTSSSLKSATRIGDNFVSGIGNSRVNEGAIDIVNVIPLEQDDLSAFIATATQPVMSLDNPLEAFYGFNESIWVIDEYKVSHRFPILKQTSEQPVNKITNVEEFFATMSSTNQNSQNMLVNDIVILGVDWDNFVLQYNMNSLGSENNPVMGNLFGAVDSGNVVLPATITFREFSTEQIAKYHSLFGYTKGFNVSNINFVFDEAMEVSAQGLESFGFLAINSNSSTYEDISVTFNQSIKVNNVESFALVVAHSSNSHFRNVKLDADVKIEEFVSFPGKNELYYGGYFAKGSISNYVKGIELGNVDLTFSALDESRRQMVIIGGLAGLVEGILDINLVKINANFTGNIKVNKSDDRTLYVGGLIGREEANICNILNTCIDIDIDVDSGANENYIGGFISKIQNVNLKNVESLGDISVKAVGRTYLGGIAGYSKLDHIFSNTNNTKYSGYSVNGVKVEGKYDFYGNGEITDVYIGGVFGYAEDAITLNGTSTKPNTEKQKTYNNIVSGVEIHQVDTETLKIMNNYIGGLFGKIYQGYYTEIDGELVLTEFASLDSTIVINDVIFMGEIYACNNKGDGENKNSYVGGISGNNYTYIQNAVSNGVVAYSSLNSDNFVYLGAISGYANNGLNYTMSMSVLNVNKLVYENKINKDIVVGGKDIKVSINGKYNYCNEEMAGMYQINNYSTIVSIDDLYFNSEKFKSMADWTFIEKNGIIVWYPKGINAMLIDDERLVPVIVNSFDLIKNADYESKKTLILNSDFECNQTNYGDFRRVIGNGHKITINMASLFDEIRLGSVISDFVICFDEIITQNGTQVGLLANQNSGAIFNIGIGKFAQNIEGTGNSVAEFSNVSDIQNIEQILSGEIPIWEINVDTCVAGAFTAVNYGSIDGVFSNIDIVLENDVNYVTLGGLVGVNSGQLVNSVANGRVITTSLSDVDASYIGGLVGDNAGVVTGCISNINLIDSVGIANINYGAIGKTLEEYIDIQINGVIINAQISYKEITTLNHTKTASNAELMNLKIVKNSGFNNRIWVQDNFENYGYVRPSKIKMDFTTGYITYAEDGKTILQYTYFMSEAIQLTNISNKSNSSGNVISNKENTRIYLVRNLITNDDASIILNELDLAIGLLCGNDKYILSMEGLDLFKTISANTEICNLGIVVLSNSFQGFAPLAKINEGTIRNVFVVGNTIYSENGDSDNVFGGIVRENRGLIDSCWTDIDFEVKDGIVGGIAGKNTLNGRIIKSFVNGDFVLRNSALIADVTIENEEGVEVVSTYSTSVGGLVGLMNSSLTNGYAIEDCYIYGSIFRINTENLRVGTLIGTLVGELKTKNTYSFVYTPSSNASAEEESTEDYKGRYINLGMVGLKVYETVSGEDTSSMVTVYLGQNTDRAEGVEYGVKVCSINVLRDMKIGYDFYEGWSGAVWAQNVFESQTIGNIHFIPYLKGVTPLERQENQVNGNVPFVQDIFDF